MIFVTGDCHGNFERFKPKYFPEQAQMTKRDIVICAGDFGGVWFGDGRDEAALDWLEGLPFTLAFVCGNHENYDALERYPVAEWHGGKVHRVRPHVLHLMRGQIFELESYRFFTMGGAKSHDTNHRINHISWWRQELPSDEEYIEALQNLERYNWQVDYIITHCWPSSIQDTFSGGLFQRDALTDFLDEVRERCRFQYWFFGHYHENMVVEKEFVMLYNQIIRLK